MSQGEVGKKRAEVKTGAEMRGQLCILREEMGQKEGRCGGGNAGASLHFGGRNGAC